MRILVTGASGYIGQHLCRALIKRDDQVRGFCRSVSQNDLTGVDWYPGNILDKTALQNAMRGCDKVVHLACLPIGPSRANPDLAFSTNALGTAVVLEAARLEGIKQFVYTSSVQVYGGQSSLPNKERNMPVPDSPYAASKLAGEIWAQMASNVYKLPVVILRLFNVYGETANGVKRGTVEEIFIENIAKGIHPRINGRAENSRDFIHISDVIQGILLALDSNISAGIFNIGTGIETQLVKLAGMIAKIMNREDVQPEFEESELPVMRYRASLFQARRTLGFYPTISLLDGLSRLVDHMLKV